MARSRFALVALAFAGVVALPPPGSGDERVPPLVKQLGAPDFHAREAATEKLKEIGEPALPAVVEAAASADPEVRTRAQGLLRTIISGARVSKSTKLEMRPIYARTFEMGSPRDEASRRPDETRHTVRVTKSYLIGAHEVTQEQYDTVRKRTPSWFCADGGGKDKVRGLNTTKFPVEQVTWFDAVAFCNALSRLDGFDPYYELTDEKRDGGAIASAKVKVLGGRGYRLPTEAEWELACRGGTEEAFWMGRSPPPRGANWRITVIGGYGGADDIFMGRTAAVGTYKPNRIGVHECHGNVAEWCGDWYAADYYEKSPRDDPRGPDAGDHRVVRGGAWTLQHTSCRSAARGFQPPGEAKNTTGFRVARGPY